MFKTFSQNQGLSIFMFHGVFSHENQKQDNCVDPQQFVLLSNFRHFVEDSLSRGYSFISPDEIASGLTPGKKYALITFDDGYFNNYHALEVLKEFNIPALFFISSNYVVQQKSFWWDVCYRQSLARGLTLRKISHLTERLKKLPYQLIEEKLISDFGKDALLPRGSIDRPFKLQELKDFSQEKLVFLGNHTMDHAILNNCSDLEINSQIKGCQDFLFSLSGRRPLVIAYPNGGSLLRVIPAAKACGLSLGATCRPHNNQLPIKPSSKGAFSLGRFFIGEGEARGKTVIRHPDDLVLRNKLKYLIRN